jgi:rhomboid protease GluP
VNENSIPTAAQPAPPPQAVRIPLPVSVPYVTYTIIGVTALVYVLQLVSVARLGSVVQGMDYLELYGARINELIRAGEIWRFFTPALLHASPPHLLFNMYALFSFGSDLERHFGHNRFFWLYALGAFAGNVFSFVLMSDNSFSVGASTAVFGLIGAEGIFLYQNRKLFGAQVKGAINNVIFVVIMNLVIGFVPGIDLWGHVGGLFGGLIFAWFGGPNWKVEGFHPIFRLVDERTAQDVFLAALAVLIPFGALAIWGMMK